MYGPSDDITFIYPSDVTQEADYKAVAAGLRAINMPRALLLNSITQQQRWEPLVPLIVQATWGQTGSHLYPYGDEPTGRGEYPEQLERCKKLRALWFAYCDGTDHIWQRNPTRSYDENRQAVDSYLQTAKAYIVRQPAMLLASEWRQGMTTSFGTADRHEPITTWVPKRIAALQAFRLAMGTALLTRLDLGWLGPDGYGPSRPMADWDPVECAWALKCAELVGVPITLCVDTATLCQQPEWLRVVERWRKGRK